MRVGLIGIRAGIRAVTVKKYWQLGFSLALGLSLSLMAAMPSDAWAKKKRSPNDDSQQAALVDGTNAKKKRKKKRKAVSSEVYAAPAVSKGSKKISAVSDAELATVYTHIASGKSAAALNHIETLLAKAPNHKLLHLLRADVLVILSQGTRAGARNSSQGVLIKLSVAKQEQLTLILKVLHLKFLISTSGILKLPPITV